MAQGNSKTSAAAQARRSKRAKIIAVVALLALCVLFALFVGTADYRASISGWLPLLVSVVAIVLSYAYLRVLRRGFKVEEPQAVVDCVRGTDVRFTARFVNNSPAFLFRADAFFYISDLFGHIASESKTTLALKPRETYDMAFTARFEHIGTYSAGVDRVVLTDFLRLFTATVPNTVHKMVQVTPHIQPITEITFSNAAMVENKRALRSVLADSLDYAYVRSYVPGDPIKNIHWKISAHTAEGTYMTRLYEVYTNPGVAVIMDFYAPARKANTLMGMFDAVVETAFSVARFAQQQGMDTELHYLDKTGEPVSRMRWDERDIPDIIDEIPRITNDPRMQSDALELIEQQTMAQYGQNNLVVCTADLSAEMVSAIIEAKMRRRDPIVFAIVPSDLVGREREDWCANLQRLDALSIGYVILAHSEELVGVKA